MNRILKVFYAFFLILRIFVAWLTLRLLGSFVLVGEWTYFLLNLIVRIITKHLLAAMLITRHILRQVARSPKMFLYVVLKITRFVWHEVHKSLSIFQIRISKIYRGAKLFVFRVHSFAKSIITFLLRYSTRPGRFVRGILDKKTIQFTSVASSLLTSLTSLFKHIPRVSLKIRKKTHSPLPPNILSQNRKNFLLMLSITVVLSLLWTAGYYSYNLYVGLPDPRDIGRVNYSLTTHVFDRNGKKLFDFYKDQNRTPILIKDLPKYVYQSSIAIEDKDFYSHIGVAPISGVARALRDWIIKKNGVQGGSTITQQLVKTSLLTPERTLVRKIKEVILALKAERIYSKNQILEMYLNQVPYGGTVYGIEEASMRYFEKHAKDLTLSEAALLAGLPQAPSDYSPFTNIKVALTRRKQVLMSMLEQGYITRSQYVIASREMPKLSQNRIEINAPHFVFYTKKYIETNLDIDELESNGYRVETSLDLEVQQKVEQILEEELQKIQYLNVTNGAVLVTKPATGEVIAMVGSKNFFADQSGEFNVTTGLRQPGSSIKPILYALAMEKGVTSATIIDDSPTVYRIGPTEVYRPVNYDGRFHGRVTVRMALANSYNIPAVKLMDKVGVVDFIEFAKKAGIDSWLDPSNYGLSLSLGGGEVTMVDMAESYSMLANYGRRTDVSPILNIIDKNGARYKHTDISSEEIIPSETAYIITDILSDNSARVAAFGPRSLLEIPGYKVAVKTGTTDEKRDNWTIGYTPDYLVVVWVGNNDHTPMNPYLTSGVTGAAPIWNRVMTYLLTEYALGQKNWYTKPDRIVEKTCFGRNEVFVRGTENSVTCVIPTPIKTAEKPQE